MGVMPKGIGWVLYQMVGPDAFYAKGDLVGVMPKGTWWVLY